MHRVCQGLLGSAVLGPSTLRTLSVAGCARLGPGAVAAIAAKGAHLRDLNIARLHAVTSASVAAVLSSCRALTRLDVSGNPALDDDFITKVRVPQGHPGASRVGTGVGLGGGTGSRPGTHHSRAASRSGAGSRLGSPVSDTFDFLNGDLGRLDRLSPPPTSPTHSHSHSHGDADGEMNFDDFPSLTDLQLAPTAVARRAATPFVYFPPYLTWLNLSDCVGVTAYGIASLAERCPGLTHLDVSGLPLLVDPAVSAVVACCRGLRDLWLDDCDGEGARGGSHLCPFALLPLIHVASFSPLVPPPPSPTPQA